MQSLRFLLINHLASHWFTYLASLNPPPPFSVPKWKNEEILTLKISCKLCLPAIRFSFWHWESAAIVKNSLYVFSGLNMIHNFFRLYWPCRFNNLVEFFTKEPKHGVTAWAQEFSCSKSLWQLSLAIGWAHILDILGEGNLILLQLYLEMAS